MGNKISAALIVNNEEKNIREVIQNLSFADEIIVVDSYSSDKTYEIAKELGAITFQREFDNFSAQRNFAIEKTDNDWILFIDADERVTDELKNNIINLLKKDDLMSAYRFKRANYFMGKRLRFGGSGGDKVIRLFNKKNCKYGLELVHERLYIQGEIGNIKGELNHYTYTDLNSYVNKINLYTSLIAYQKNKNKNKKISALFIISKMLARFVKFYFIKLGFLDGKVGFIVAFLALLDSFLRSVKMWRITEGEEV